MATLVCNTLCIFALFQRKYADFEIDKSKTFRTLLLLDIYRPVA